MSVPSTGTLALDVMCGPWGASKCSALRWYEFMGTKSTFVPFQINYRNQTKPLVDGFTPLNPTTTSCSKSIDVSIKKFIIDIKSVLKRYQCWFHIFPFFTTDQNEFDIESFSAVYKYGT